jgi:hypothetical protein
MTWTVIELIYYTNLTVNDLDFVRKPKPYSEGVNDSINKNE